MHSLAACSQISAAPGAARLARTRLRPAALIKAAAPRPPLRPAAARASASAAPPGASEARGAASAPGPAPNAPKVAEAPTNKAWGFARALVVDALLLIQVREELRPGLGCPRARSASPPPPLQSPAAHARAFRPPSPQRLWLLVRRVRAAAAALRAAAAAAPAPEAAPGAAALAALAAAGRAGAASAAHLRSTLCEATATAEERCSALHGAAADGMGRLFAATAASAAALEAAALQGADLPRAAAAAVAAHESAAAVREHEDTLRAQIFAQVYAELNAAAA
jgi:hypothetical protein